jgi:hypothetical protein
MDILTIKWALEVVNQERYKDIGELEKAYRIEQTGC